MTIPQEYLDEWNKQSADDDWTAELSGYLLDALSELEIEGEVLDVSCRSSLCRVKVEFANLSEAQRFSTQAQVTERQKFVRLENAAGRIRVDALLTR